MNLVLLLLANLCALLGAVLLALSQQRNWRAVSGSTVEERPRIRRPAWALLMTTFAISIWRDGASFGIVLGFLLLGAAFIAVAMMLTYRPHWLRPVVFLCQK